MQPLSATGLLMPPEGPGSGVALYGANLASGVVEAGCPNNLVVTPFLSLHGAALVRLGEVQYELRYPITAPHFGEREIDVVDVVLPVVAQSELDALEIAEIVLGGHTPPELMQAQPVAEEVALPRSGYHRRYADGNRTGNG